MILTQIIIFRATLFPFQQAGHQFHDSNYLEVSKIPATPQTRNPHEWPRVRQPLNTFFALPVVVRENKRPFGIPMQNWRCKVIFERKL